MRLIFRLLIGICISFLLTSCATRKRCQERFPPEVREVHSHTVETIVKDTVIPGETITHTIFRDSLIVMPVNKWKVIKDTSGIAELRYYKDAYGNVLAQCVANDRAIEKVTQLEKKLSASTEKSVIVEYKSPWWVNLLLFISVLSNLFWIGLFIWIKFKNVIK